MCDLSCVVQNVLLSMIYHCSMCVFFINGTTVIL